MTGKTNSKDSIRIHFTNVVGAGATQLLQSLLPALEANDDVTVDTLYLPDKGPLQNYQSVKGAPSLETYRRRLPNALSRILECTIFGRKFSGSLPLLVLGDLPIRCAAPQTVFVQTAHLLKPQKFHHPSSAIKFWIARCIFQLNQKYAQAFIVQTQFMRDALIATYPALKGRVHVVAQPVPAWLLGNKLQYRPRHILEDTKLKLIYPAAGYPHKNHHMLAAAETLRDVIWPVEALTLTVEEEANPAPATQWIKCRGFLSPEQMIQAYAEADSLLFLSSNESYGFPLIEAMFIGLPIICPDLPYAKALCGSEAIYFGVNDVRSLNQACLQLKTRLMQGWKPDWSSQIERLPKSWASVAEQILDVIRHPDTSDRTALPHSD